MVIELSQNWPMPEYLEAWKLFRKNGNENQITADALTKLSSWPKNSNLDICDLGCGDGRLLSEVIARVEGINSIHLIDPYKPLLNEAEQLIRDRYQGLKISKLLGSVREIWPRCAAQSDVVLAVHMVYLLEPAELQILIRERPLRAITYIVLDSPSSVFTELWRHTSSKYFHRSQLAHQELCKYLKFEAPPIQVFQSRIPKNLLTNHEYSAWLLSILCYRDMVSDVPSELKAVVGNIIDRYTDPTGEYIECESVCYELPPK